jgi:hypothetical protein
VIERFPGSGGVRSSPRGVPLGVEAVLALEQAEEVVGLGRQRRGVLGGDGELDLHDVVWVVEALGRPLGLRRRLGRLGRVVVVGEQTRGSFAGGQGHEQPEDEREGGEGSGHGVSSL